MEEKRKNVFFDVIANIIHTRLAIKENEKRIQVENECDREFKAECERFYAKEKIKPIPAKILLTFYEQEVAVNDLLHGEYVEMLGHFERELQENPTIRELVEMFV